MEVGGRQEEIAKEEDEDSKEEEEEQSSIASIKRAGPIKLSKGQIKVSHIHKSGLPSGGGAVPFSR